MNTQHTPGPWQVGSAFDNYGETEIAIEHMTPAGNLVVAVALGGLVGQDANARLIAAAPDLLDAAKLALRIAESCIHDQLDGTSSLGSALAKLEPVRAAIAKATVAA